MGRKKKKYNIPIWKYNPNKEEESKNPKFIQIYHSQLTDETFLKLSNIAKVIYFYMLDYSNGKQITTFPHRIYTKITTKPTFNKAIKELVKKGFIEIVNQGKFTRTENEYKFICEWRN